MVVVGFEWSDLYNGPPGNETGEARWELDHTGFSYASWTQRAKILHLERWKGILAVMRNTLSPASEVFLKPKENVRPLSCMKNELISYRSMNILHDQQSQRGMHRAICATVDNMYTLLYAVCPPKTSAESLAASQILVLGKSLGSFLLCSSGWRFMLRNTSAWV